MKTLRLGRTDLQVTCTSFGALPIQRVDFDTARTILRKAHEAGITFYDTARGYSDSEEKIGCSLADVRQDILIATKTPARDKKALLRDLDTSLEKLKTDRVDILQLHGAGAVPDPDDPDSPYAGLLEARRQGKTRFLGITTHKLDVAIRAASSGLFDTVQFPLSALSSPEDLALIDVCRQADVGVIAMKALVGGLLTNIRAAFAFLWQHDNVVPIWGIQRERELDAFLELDADPPALDDAMRAEIEKERETLSGNYCRGCGYCLPCPAEIPINMASRMSFLLRRAPTEKFLTPEWQEKMERIENCTDCGHCREHCPYELDPPAMLREQLADYRTFLT
jgi:predicted aldo/keto reductase-like oxidoreductase